MNAICFGIAYVVLMITLVVIPVGLYRVHRLVLYGFWYPNVVDTTEDWMMLRDLVTAMYITPTEKTEP